MNRIQLFFNRKKIKKEMQAVEHYFSENEATLKSLILRCCAKTIKAKLARENKETLYFQYRLRVPLLAWFRVVPFVHVPKIKLITKKDYDK